MAIFLLCRGVPERREAWHPLHVTSDTNKGNCSLSNRRTWKKREGSRTQGGCWGVRHGCAAVGIRVGPKASVAGTDRQDGPLPDVCVTDGRRPTLPTALPLSWFSSGRRPSNNSDQLGIHQKPSLSNCSVTNLSSAKLDSTTTSATAWFRWAIMCSASVHEAQ